jgi:hypothetical protein
MSFNKMSVKELRAVAEMFGVDVAGLNKATVLKTLEDEGVTYESYEAFSSAEKVTPEEEGYVTPTAPVSDSTLTLIKMTRPNPSYEIMYGKDTYVFTHRHPYVAVPEDVADFIFDTEQGFQIATPKEVRSFYG